MPELHVRTRSQMLWMFCLTGFGLDLDLDCWIPPRIKPLRCPHSDNHGWRVIVLAIIDSQATPIYRS